MSSKLHQPEKNQPIPQIDEQELGPTIDQQGGNQFEQQHMGGLGQDPAQPSTLDVLMEHGVPETRAGETDKEPSDTVTASAQTGDGKDGSPSAGQDESAQDPWTERVESLQRAHGKIDGMVGGLQGQATSALGASQASLLGVQGQISQWAHNEAQFLNESFAHSLLKSFPGADYFSDGVTLASLLNTASNATPWTKLIIGGGLAIAGTYIRKSREDNLNEQKQFLSSRHKTISQMGLALHKSKSLSNAEVMKAFLDNAIDVNDLTWRGGMLSGAKPFFGTTIGLLKSSKSSNANPDSEVSKKVLDQADMALDMYDKLGPGLLRDRARLPRFAPSIQNKAATFMSAAIGGYTKFLAGDKPLGLSGSVVWKSADGSRLEVDSKLTSLGSTDMALVGSETKAFINKNLRTIMKKHGLQATFDGMVTSSPATRCDRVVTDSTTSPEECGYADSPTHHGKVSLLLDGTGPVYNATGDEAWASIDLSPSEKTSLLYDGITKGT